PFVDVERRVQSAGLSAQRPDPARRAPWGDADQGPPGRDPDGRNRTLERRGAQRLRLEGSPLAQTAVVGGVPMVTLPGTGRSPAEGRSRFVFVLEQTLGQVAHTRNIERALAEEESIDPTLIYLYYRESSGLWRLLFGLRIWTFEASICARMALQRRLRN